MKREKYKMPQKSDQLFRLNVYQVCIICDSNLKKHEIGSGFVFLRKDWIITAAHVVIEDGISRKGLYAKFPTPQNNIVFVKVIAVHIENDIALLQIVSENNPCLQPLFPGYDYLSVSRGLVICGYTPSKNNIVISLTHVYEKDFRHRWETETILEFEAQGVESGCSGGPIFGDGGVVLGILINIFEDLSEPPKKFARATSIQNLMNCINIDFEENLLNPYIEKSFED